jgi:hypothetical protein
MWPAVIDVINSYATYYRRKDKKPDDPLAHRIGYWTRATALGTWFAAILAGVAACVFWRQLDVMQETLNATYSDSRPLVGVYMVEMAPIAAGNDLSVTLDLQNGGKSIATNIRSLAVMQFLAPDKPEPTPPKRLTNVPVSIGMILPGASIKAATANGPVIYDLDVKNINSGKSILWVYGRLEYQDRDGKPHWMTYTAYYRTAEHALWFKHIAIDENGR